MPIPTPTQIPSTSTLDCFLILFFDILCISFAVPNFDVYFSEDKLSLRNTDNLYNIILYIIHKISCYENFPPFRYLFLDTLCLLLLLASRIEWKHSTTKLFTAQLMTISLLILVVLEHVIIALLLPNK